MQDNFGSGQFKSYTRSLCDLLDESMLRRTVNLLTLLILAAFIGACSQTNPQVQDPYENLNRKIFTFNKGVDKIILKPVAYVYWKYVPSPAQSGVGNFFDNLRELTNIANDLLQGEFAFAAGDTTRSLINSTIGIGGLFDPADSLGLAHRKVDFGQTLYKWGYKNSAYFVLPLVGPSTIRDAIGLTFDYTIFSVWLWVEPQWRYPLLAIDTIDLRARAFRHEAVFNLIAVDEYVFMRNAYFQHRQFVFNGGKEVAANEPNPYSDEGLPKTDSKGGVSEKEPKKEEKEDSIDELLKENPA